MTARTQWKRFGAGALVAGALYYAYPKPEVAAVAAAPPQSDPFAFVRSMEGTRPDGEVRQSAEGQLVVDAELGHLFDYYLAGLGEKDLQAIRAEIERELDRRLAPGPAAQAKRLLTSYLDYKRALADAEKSLVPLADLAKAGRARLELKQRLRPQFFSASDAAGLFGAGDAYDADALARLDIEQNGTLTPAQRELQLATLDKRMPATLREDREAPTKVIRTEASVQKLREQGAGDDEVYRLRAAAFSPDAAGRLAELDREENAWKGRIKTYLAQRANLGAVPEAMLQQVRDQHFSAEEQRRLGAYE
ncbi:lipase secretion chaperone [Massilia pseudoviolaceinigra]|uniref:lipase secretion chaperone n=1 Tax=Massilia pseudoviolaceinigra TaxID=3057165 RepID=UPI0027968CBC|nr:lipase secretion chaperone [Massilia sp. CCM 9206]MDQ1924091.1 lipase secretion chaperone [Massilia sp. CCM 9206]